MYFPFRRWRFGRGRSRPKGLFLRRRVFRGSRINEANARKRHTRQAVVLALLMGAACAIGMYLGLHYTD